MTGAVRPLRARYVGYSKDTENHGDEALLWIVRDCLAPEIVVAPDLQEFEIALLGGGTLINQSPWLIYEFASHLKKAGRGVVLGTGVGDTLFWGDRFGEWEPLLNACDFVGVRGPDSVALLHAHGIEKAISVGDPYLWLRRPMECDPVPRRLGINFGNTNNALVGRAADAELHSTLEETLRILQERKWTFVWVSVWSKDLPLMAAVREKIAEPRGPLFDARTQSLEAYSALAGCDVFLGEKLHGCAMAAVAGVPFLALEYQPKVRDFAASIDMGECVISTAERDPLVLADRIERLREERETHRERMIRARDTLRTRFGAFVREIKAAFGANP